MLNLLIQLSLKFFFHSQVLSELIHLIIINDLLNYSIKTILKRTKFYEDICY